MKQKRSPLILGVYSYLLFTLAFFSSVLAVGLLSELATQNVKEGFGMVVLILMVVAPISWILNAIPLVALLKFTKRIHVLRDEQFLYILSLCMGLMPLTTLLPLFLFL